MFIFASQIWQSIVPLFIDLSQSDYVSLKPKKFHTGEICELPETKVLFWMPCLFIIVLLPHLWRVRFLGRFKYKTGLESFRGVTYHFVDRTRKYCVASVHQQIVTPLILTDKYFCKICILIQMLERWNILSLTLLVIYPRFWFVLPLFYSITLLKQCEYLSIQRSEMLIYLLSIPPLCCLSFY